MIDSTSSALRDDLLVRRRRLAAVPQLEERPDLGALLRQVDDALDRVASGAWGLCEVCHEGVEEGRLRADPLVRVCLGCLSEEESRALELDLETAATVQAALLPPAAGHLDGWRYQVHYRPLGPVSGDHFDLVRPEGGNGDVYFLFGDVSGKGVAASILMSHLHALFRGLVSVGLPLAELVGRINRLFTESTAANAFATLVAGRLTGSGQVELANAGHPPPLLARRGDVVALEGQGLPVGMFRDVDFPVERHELGAGDLLLLYTDGVTEALGAGGEEYGAERLLEVLRGLSGPHADDAVGRCLADLDAFLGGGAPRDDLTVMALERRA